MVKVVLDTNVIISGLTFIGGKPAEILILAVYGRIKNFTSNHIIEETRNTLIRKFSWTKSEVEAAVLWLKTCSQVVNPRDHISIITQDEPDNRIIECAHDANADYIVTGDRHLLDLEIYQGISIVNPAAFLELFKE